MGWSKNSSWASLVYKSEELALIFDPRREDSNSNHGGKKNSSHFSDPYHLTKARKPQQNNAQPSLRF